MNKKLLLFVLGVVFVVLISFILKTGVFDQTKPQAQQSNPKVNVVASFYPLYFFTSQIGGDKVEVTNITPAGAEPHDYEPTTGDIAKIENSRMLVLNGGVEAWGDKIKDNLKGKNVELVVAGDGLLTQQLTENGETGADPHIWLDSQLAKKEAHAIEQGLEKVDPNNTSSYQANEKTLDDKLDQLDSDYKKGLANCTNKNIITSHAAFGYLANRYGLKQVPIAGLSPDAEPSAQQLVDVAKFAKANNVDYIFFESLVSPKLSETIATEIGAKTLVLDPLEGLIDSDIKAGKDYFSVMHQNLDNLRTALKCT